MFPFFFKKKKWGLALCLPYNQGTPFDLRRVRPSVLAALIPFIYIFHPLLSLARSQHKPNTVPSQSRTMQKIISTNACIQQITHHKQ